MFCPLAVIYFQAIIQLWAQAYQAFLFWGYNSTNNQASWTFCVSGGNLFNQLYPLLLAYIVIFSVVWNQTCFKCILFCTLALWTWLTHSQVFSSFYKLLEYKVTFYITEFVFFLVTFLLQKQYQEGLILYFFLNGTDVRFQLMLIFFYFV